MAVALAESQAPILVKNEDISWRDEKPLYIQIRKCKCGSVWCPSCSVLGWSKRVEAKMMAFDYKRTRLLMLSIDPKLYKDGQEALRDVMDGKLIPGLVRNLARGKMVKQGSEWVCKFPPISISKYMWFVEWHKSGLPHFHVLIEVEREGKAGMIGQDRIHHYWGKRGRIHESYIKSQKHWRYMTGYFGTHGYFKGDKDHQTRLPAWALNLKDGKIHRLGGSRSSEVDRVPGLPRSVVEAFREMIGPGLISDMIEGLRSGNRIERTYRERLESCGQKSWVRIMGVGLTVEAIVNIPYKKLRSELDGVYKPGWGFLSAITEIEKDEFLSKREAVRNIIYFPRELLPKRIVIKEHCGNCCDRTYQKFKELRGSRHVYTCLRCKNEVNYRQEKPNGHFAGVSVCLRDRDKRDPLSDKMA